MPINRSIPVGVETSEIGGLEAVGKGLLVGAGKDPIIGAGLRAVGVPDELFDKFEEQIAGSSLGDIASIVGEYGPSFALGAGAYGLGRAAFLGVARASAGSLAALGAESFAGRQGLALAARIASEKFLATGVGEAVEAGGITLLERGAQIAGGAAGTSGLEAISAAVKGGDQQEVVQSAAIAGVLTGAIDLGLSALGGVLSPIARKAFSGLSESAGLAGFEEGAAPQLVRALKEREKVALSGNVKPATMDRIDNVGRQLEALTQAERAAAEAKPFKPAPNLPGMQPVDVRTARAAAGEAERIGSLIDEARVLSASRITREAPIGETGDTKGFFDSLMQFLIQRPEASASKLGRTVAAAVKKYADAEATLAVERPLRQAKVVSMLNELADSVGGGRKNLAELRETLRPVLATYEAQGVSGVASKYGTQAGESVRRLGTMLREAYEPINRNTASETSRYLTAPEIARLVGPGGEYLPQVLKKLEPQELRKRLVEGYVKQGIPEAQAVERVTRMLTAGRINGIEKIGSLDFARTLEGTLEQKIAQGLPFEDYVDGILRYADDTLRRRVLGDAFGYEKDQIGGFVEAVTTAAVGEGANPRLVTSVMDSLLLRPYQDQVGRRLAQSLNSLQTATKLTLAPLANLTQSATTAVQQGLVRTIRGARSLLSASTREDAARFAALQETEFDALRRVLGGAESDNWLDKAARLSLAPFFNPTERFNRRLASATSILTINDTVARALKGRLKGTSLDAARRAFASVDLNLDRLLAARRGELDRVISQQGKGIAEVVDSVFGDGAYQRSIYKMVQQSQYTPGLTRIPPAFNTTLGKLAFQFKSFGLNQGIFLRDKVLGEFALGNARPLMTFAGLYPIAGELVASSLAGIKGRDRQDGVSRVLEDITSVGGAGLIQSAIVAGQYGRLSDFALGPTASDFISLAEAASGADAGRLGAQLSRTPLVVATRRLAEGGAMGGALLGDVLEDYLPGDASNDALTMDEYRQLLIRSPGR